MMCHTTIYKLNQITLKYENALLKYMQGKQNLQIITTVLNELYAKITYYLG